MLDLGTLEQLRPSSLLEAPAAGRPVEIALDVIEFDPEQPRRHIDAQRLEELARTIRQCGVIQPISVHARPGVPGRYLVNVGERRVRAARLAGCATIPAFVEAPLGAYARVIENLAREDLSPFDLATFILEREQAGETRTAIAAGLGKSPSFVTELAELGTAPAAVRELHAAGRCSDVRILYRLCKLHAVNPRAIESLTQGPQPITRARIDAITAGAVDDAKVSQPPSKSKAVGRRRRVDALLVEVEGRMAFLPLVVPESMGSARVVYEDGSREQVSLSRLRLIQWTTLK